MGGTLLFGRNPAFEHLVQNILGVKISKFVKSQNFDGTLGPQKPTCAKFLEFESFFNWKD